MVAPVKQKKQYSLSTNIVKATETYFLEVRSFKYFKYLHLGLIANIKRKTFPEIARVV
ncbi:transposase [Synechocystis sp. CACIAM 05]|nr:transposase [Synechocystis sp. CACIAM 05]